MASKRPTLQASSRNSSIYHAPLNPSNLRKSHEPPSSPDEESPSPQGSDEDRRPHVGDGGIHPVAGDDASVHSSHSENQIKGGVTEPAKPTAHTHLLQLRLNHHASCGPGPCNHGTFSPHPLPRSSDEPRDYFGGRYEGGIGAGVGGNSSTTNSVVGDAVADGLLGGGQGSKMSTTQSLAKRHGVKNKRMM